MKKRNAIIVITILVSYFFIFLSESANAFFWETSKKTSPKKVYVRSFEIENLQDSETFLQKRTKELIEETFQNDDNYSITTDDDIGVFLNHEAKKMSLGECSSDACIRKLMEKTNAEILIYGRIRKINEYTYITARLMDRSGGIPKVSKIRTIKYHYDDFFEKGVKALAQYLLTGRDNHVKQFMDEVYEKEEENKYREKMSIKQKEYMKTESDFRYRIWKAAEARKEELTKRSSQFRLGWSLIHETADDTMNTYFTEQRSYFLDWIYRLEVKPIWNYDLYCRGYSKIFTMDNAPINPEGKIGEDIIYKSTAVLYGLDAGVRIRYQTYFFMTVFDLYFLSALRFQIYDEFAKDTRVNNDEITAAIYSTGIYFGCGIEIAFFKNIGLFMEYNIGYTPVGTGGKNVEGNQVYIGATYRTTPSDSTSSKNSYYNSIKNSCCTGSCLNFF